MARDASASARARCGRTRSQQRRRCRPIGGNIAVGSETAFRRRPPPYEGGRPVHNSDAGCFRIMNEASAPRASSQEPCQHCHGARAAGCDRRRGQKASPYGRFCAERELAAKPTRSFTPAAV